MSDTKIKCKEHKKIRNTGILMELLQRQIVTDLLQSDNSKAYEIIQKYFNPNTELFKEYRLYESLVNEKFTNDSLADEFISRIVESRKKINNQKLKNEKYFLLKEIKDNFGIDSFFSTRIGNYKLHASISNLFENQVGNTIDPVIYTRSKEMLLEHIKPKQIVESKENELDEYKNLSKDLRILAYRLMVEQFNVKYSGLNVKQKQLLSEYIQNLTDTVKIKKYVNDEIIYLKKSIADYNKRIDDSVIKLKVNEAQKSLTQLTDKQPVTEQLIERVLQWYSLIDEIESVIKK